MASRRFEGVFPAALEFAGFGMPRRRAAAQRGEQGGRQQEGVWDQRESGRGRWRPNGGAGAKPRRGTDGGGLPCFPVGRR